MERQTKMYRRYGVTYAAAVFTVLMMLATWYSTSIKDSLNYSLSEAIYGDHKTTAKKTRGAAPHLTVRSVYMDSTHDQGHVIFLIEVRKSILSQNSIVACTVGEHSSTTLKTRTLYANGPLRGQFIDERPYITHAMAMVDCFGLPSVKNGSHCSLTFINPSGFLLPAESERPLMIEPKLVEGNRPDRILCCTAVLYGKPPYIQDWLTYQKVIGIDHVYMIASNSFQDLNQPYISRAISEGFLTVEVWQEHLRTGLDVRYHSQVLAYQDCIYRFRQLYDYVMMTDQDDFFVPLVPNVTLRYYIDGWCINSGSCSFKWIEYNPGCGMKDGPAVDGNLTTLLVSSEYIELDPPKSMHKLSAVREVGIHRAQEYVNGYGEVEVPKEVAYIAHLRRRGASKKHCNQNETK